MLPTKIPPSVILSEATAGSEVEGPLFACRHSAGATLGLLLAEWVFLSGAPHKRFVLVWVFFFPS